MDNIPVHLLNAFTVFNNSANIVEAAAKLQITQPALSKQLKHLETLLPDAVFTLSGRKKVLTPFGQDLHLRLNERLGNIQQLIQQSWTLHSKPETATLRIVGRRGVLDRFSGKVDFAGNLFFQELPNEEALSSVLHLESEIGIVHHLPDSLELIAKPLFREEFQLVIPKSMFDKKPQLGESLFTKLKNLPCLGYRPEDEIIQQLCAYSKSEMRELKMVRATESYLSLAEMLETRKAWAVLPAYLKISESKNWIVPVPVKAVALRQFFIVYRKEFASVPWFRALIGEIRECFK